MAVAAALALGGFLWLLVHLVNQAEEEMSLWLETASQEEIFNAQCEAYEREYGSDI